MTMTAPSDTEYLITRLLQSAEDDVTLPRTYGPTLERMERLGRVVILSRQPGYFLVRQP
jgi:hypothetical protein